MSWFSHKRIVVPVDFSEDARDAVATALELITDPAELHVIHVLPELSPSEPMVMWEAYESDQRRAHAEAELRKWVGDSVPTNVVLHIVVGDPGQEIALYADRYRPSLIVMPSHGRTGIQRLLIGSVAERVLRLAHCPVLVLRKPRG